MERGQCYRHHRRRRTGFAANILGRIGEPYISSRPTPAAGSGEVSGLGLGLFIAKTLLERSGATLGFANRVAPEHGALVTVRWPRAQFERPLTFGAT